MKSNELRRKGYMMSETLAARENVEITCPYFVKGMNGSSAVLEIDFLGQPKAPRFLVIHNVVAANWETPLHKRPIPEEFQWTLWDAYKRADRAKAVIGDDDSIHETLWEAKIALTRIRDSVSYEEAAKRVSEAERSSANFSGWLDLQENRLGPVAEAINDASNEWKLSTNLQADIYHTGGGCMAVVVFNSWACDQPDLNEWDFPYMMITDLDGPIVLGVYENSEDEDPAMFDIATYEEVGDDGLASRKAPAMVVSAIRELWDASNKMRNWGSYGATEVVVPELRSLDDPTIVVSDPSLDDTGRFPRTT